MIGQIEVINMVVEYLQNVFDRSECEGKEEEQDVLRYQLDHHFEHVELVLRF